MKKWILTILIFYASITNAATLVGQVVGVTDGDTVTVLDAVHTQYKVRLAGIFSATDVKF